MSQDRTSLPAITPVELARVACGWNPEAQTIPAAEREHYRWVLEIILRAIRVKDPRLPLVPELRWDVTDAEKLYSAEPVLQARPAYRWAGDTFPEAVPGLARDPALAGNGDDEQLERFFNRVREAWRKTPNEALQKELASNLKQAGFRARSAAGIAAAIGPKGRPPDLRSTRPR